MLNAADNILLTRTGPGTPMGELFRRFWVPVLLSCELPKPDGPPKRVRILSEDLIAFRDSSGRVGLTEPSCPHRGANLFWGRNEQGGIRCAFHGWKFDVDGKCMDMPSVPNSAEYCKRIRLKAYPTCEHGDMIWAYMGPGEAPPFPELEFTLVAPPQRFVSKKFQASNWAQACEGGLDTAHFSFLHMSVAEDEEALRKAVAHADASQAIERILWMKRDGMPRFSTIAHPAGLVIGGARTADEGRLYWRISQFLMPNHGLAPNAFPGESFHGQTWVPIDDTSCWIYCYTWNPEREITAAERENYRNSFAVHAKVDENWVPLANQSNDYLIDRDEQANNSYTGIVGVSEQDACIQESQGPIADRTREHLGPTDLGIVRFRQLVLGAAKALANGQPPAAAHAAAAYRVRSGGAMGSDSASLTQVMLERFGHPHGHADLAFNISPADAARDQQLEHAPTSARQ